MQNLSGTIWKLAEVRARNEDGQEIESPIPHPLGITMFGDAVKVWIGPDGQCRIWCNQDRLRGTGSGFDGTTAIPSAACRGQAPQPRSGAPKAPGLRAARPAEGPCGKPSVSI